jgi:tRNA nucleotidyltransferase/poly(A) polymerase
LKEDIHEGGVDKIAILGASVMSRLSIRGLRSRLSPELHLMLREVLRVAEEKRLRLFLVGGPVRDWLFDNKIDDLDLCVESDDMDVSGRLAQDSAPQDAKVVVHKQFGTARIQSDGGSLDIAITRREKYRNPGALPVVSPASLITDLGRRDFSVNAIAFALSSEAKAQGASLVDPYGGVRDLERGRLRVLHKDSFFDDPTRSLRAARFSARFSLSLDQFSRNALVMALESGCFSRVKKERFRREFEKLAWEGMRGSDLKRAITLLHGWGVIEHLAPALNLTDESRASIGRLQKAFLSEPWNMRILSPWKTLLRVWLGVDDPKICKRVLDHLAIRGKAAGDVVRFRERSRTTLRSIELEESRGLVDQLLSGLSEEDLLSLFCLGGADVRRRLVRFCQEDRHLRLPVNSGELRKLRLSGSDLGIVLKHFRILFLNGEYQGPVNARSVARLLASREG